MLPLRFLPEHAVDGIPNVVVDGSPNPSTRLTLSHWPGSPTPADVLADLSAQIAFRALDHPDWFAEVEVVTNNHFDQDGLCSVYVLVQPASALARRDLVVDVARAGDFGTFHDRRAARIAFAIAAHDDPGMSPLGPGTLQGGYGQVCGRLYEAVLPQMTELLDHPERFRPLWESEDAHLDESLAAIQRGEVTIEERPDLDLAVVRVPETFAERATHRFTRSQADALHPMAVNQSTACLRIVTVQGARVRLECRYESWVMLTSRPVMPRPDLRPLAAVLDALEPSGATWAATAPSALTPTLEPADGHSDLAPDTVLDVITAHLAAAPPAWDPFSGR